MEEIRYTIEFKNSVYNDLDRLSLEGLNLMDKFEAFLLELCVHPTKGTGKVERLKHYKDAFVYSRRINKKHRLTYQILEEEKKVIILSAYDHY